MEIRNYLNNTNYIHINKEGLLMLSEKGIKEAKLVLQEYHNRTYVLITVILTAIIAISTALNIILN